MHDGGWDASVSHIRDAWFTWYANFACPFYSGHDHQGAQPGDTLD